MSEKSINECFDEIKDENIRLMNELSFERNLNNILENIRNNSLILIQNCKCITNQKTLRVIKQFNSIYTDLKAKQNLIKFNENQNQISVTKTKSSDKSDDNFRTDLRIQQKSVNVLKGKSKQTIDCKNLSKVDNVLIINKNIKQEPNESKVESNSKFNLIAEMLTKNSNNNNENKECVDNCLNSSNIFENSDSNVIEMIECEPSFDSILDDSQEMDYSSEDLSIVSSNAESGSFVCRVCQMNFEQKTRLQNHLVKQHRIPGFECDLCEYKTVSKYHLNRHKACHSSEKPFKCTIDGCDKWFKTKDYLYEHKKLIHTIEKRFKCDLCDYKTNCKTNLTHHLSRHSTERPYKCPIDGCNKTFKSKKSLKTHKSPSHSSFQSIQLYECNSCDFITNSKPKLSLHQNIHSVDKQFECQLCHEWFNTEMALTEHRLEIHPNKHYFCDFPECGKSFSSNQYLKTHKINTHFINNL